MGVNNVACVADADVCSTARSVYEQHGGNVAASIFFSIFAVEYSPDSKTSVHVR